MQHWLPNNKSAVLIDDFQTPKELAEFLLNLNENDIEYETYLQHKRLDQQSAITNHILLHQLATRPYQTKTLIPDFECFICSNRFEKRITKGYECGETLIFPQMEGKRVTDLDWQSYVKQGKCEAETLQYFLSKNVPYSEHDFTSSLIERYEHGLCEL